MNIFNEKMKRGMWSITLALTACVSCSTEEQIGVTRLQIAQQSPAFLQTGFQLQLNASIIPDDATNSTLVWSSSNTRVAEVDPQGLVTGLEDGDVTITVQAEEDPTLEDTIDLSVNDASFTMVFDNTTTVTILTDPELDYEYQIDFNGDGIFPQTFETGDVTSAAADLNGDGPHLIRIRGKFPAIQFGVVASDNAQRIALKDNMSKKIIDIPQWGNIAWSSMHKAFEGCENLVVTATDIPDLTGVEDMADMFKNAKRADPDVRHWEVSQVVDMSGMFEGAARANPDMSRWNITKKLLNMDNMLDNSGISSIDYAGALLNFRDRAQQQTINTITLGAADKTFCDFALAAKDSLQEFRGWQFIDAGTVNCN